MFLDRCISENFASILRKRPKREQRRITIATRRKIKIIGRNGRVQEEGPGWLLRRHMRDEFEGMAAMHPGVSITGMLTTTNASDDDKEELVAASICDCELASNICGRFPKTARG